MFNGFVIEDSASLQEGIFPKPTLLEDHSPYSFVHKALPPYYSNEDDTSLTSIDRNLHFIHLMKYSPEKVMEDP